MSDSSEANLHFLDYWRVIKNRWSIMLLSFLLILTTAAITVYFLPRQYFSKVLMQVKSDESGMKIFRDDPMRGQTDMRFAPTQFQIIQSKEIIYPVIDNLKLQEKWAINGQALPKEQAYFKVLKQLDPREVRNTDLIQIGIYNTDPQEAAAIANAIAIVYEDRRRTNQSTGVSGGLGQLKETLLQQRKKVEAAAAEVTAIRLREGIVDFNPETIEQAEGPENRVLLAHEEAANDASEKAAKLRSQLQQIQQLKPEELVVALRLLEIEDPTVAKVLPEHQTASSEEARLLSSGLGENHPRVKSLRAQKEVFSNQLSAALANLSNSLQTRLAVAESDERALQGRLEESREQYQKSRTLSVAYREAKNDYIQAKKILEAAEMRFTTESMQHTISIQPTEIWEWAEPAVAPSKPNVPALMTLAVLVGLIVSVGLAFFIEYLDTSVKTLEDVERFLSTPVLAVIPKNVSVLMYSSQSDSPDAEAYRILRTNIEFNRKNPDAKSLTIISGGPGEGKSTTLCNLAYTFAKGGYSVLLIDADLRRPSQHSLFKVENKIGLSDHLRGRLDIDETIQDTPVENLSLVTSGRLPGDSIGILNSQRMVDVLDRMKRRYDLVLVDSPPILGVSDGAVLVSEVDMTLMVIQHRRFPRAMLLRVKNAVITAGGNLLGAVLNKVDQAQDEGYSYYTQYTDYYADEDKPKKDRREPAQAAARTATSAPARSSSADPEEY